MNGGERRGGARTLLSVNGERYSVGADGSAELYAYGTLTGNTGSSLTVTAEDSTTWSCAYPAGLDLTSFPLGTHVVKMHCHLIGGALQLEYMKSDSAVVEVKS